MLVRDLFSCVGGHAIGYMREGFYPLQFVEINPFRQTVLRKHFPDTRLESDIHHAKGYEGSWCYDTGVVIGGPPCQETSIAAAIHGKRTGKSLWEEMRRYVGESYTDWVIVEQPAGNKNWENKVQSGLEEDGWAVQWHTLTASELGYPHTRRRRFALANRDLSRLEVAGLAIPSAIASIKRVAITGGFGFQPVPRTMRMADGVSRGLDRRQRIEAIGDSNPPEMAQVLFRAIKEAG